MQPFDEVIAFDRPTAGADGYGGPVTGWTSDAYTCRGAFRYLRGGEQVQAARLEGRQPVVLTIWNTSEASGIGTDWRMRDTHRGDVYAIRAIVPSDDRRFLEVTCEKGATA